MEPIESLQLLSAGEENSKWWPKCSGTSRTGETLKTSVAGPRVGNNTGAMSSYYSSSINQYLAMSD